MILAMLLKKLQFIRHVLPRAFRAAPKSDQVGVQLAVHSAFHEHLSYSECFLMLNSAKIFEHCRYPHLSQCPECQQRLLETLGGKVGLIIE